MRYRRWTTGQMPRRPKAGREEVKNALCGRSCRGWQRQRTRCLSDYNCDTFEEMAVDKASVMAVPIALIDG